MFKKKKNSVLKSEMKWAIPRIKTNSRGVEGVYEISRNTEEIASGFSAVN